MAERPHDPDARPPAVDFAAANGWDRDYETFSDFDLPTYVGPTTFMNLPWITDPAELRARDVDVAIIGAPFDDAVSHRPGARFGPRAIREAQYTSGSVNSLQLGVEPFELLTVVDAGDANIVPAWIERGHALIYRKVREVAATGAIPIVLGGDHSITWPTRDARSPRSAGRAASGSSTSTPTPTRPTTTGACSPATARRCGGSSSRARSTASNFVQVGLRGYWPPVDVFEWMQEHGLRWHFMTEIEERGAEAVDRRRDRRGARRARRDLPEPRHRRRRSRARARAPARPSRAGC